MLFRSRTVCDRFDDKYWRHKDAAHEFPREFRTALADGGWLGITMPTEHGGGGLGITHAAAMMQTIGESAGTMAACSTVHVNIFGPQAMVVHGTEEQKTAMIPPLVSGEDQPCFGVTEADAGLDTSKVATRAVRQGDTYLINGSKIWTSTAQVANKIILLARTTPAEPGERLTTEGLSLFYTDLDRKHIEVKEIRKMGRAAVDSNMIFINDLEVPAAHRIGPEGAGFKILLDSLNPERILIASEAIGIGRRAVSKAVRYAKERVVFDRPIGSNQSIQHPLAESWMELEAAQLMVAHAAGLYDSGAPCGAEANTAKFLGAEAAFRACDRAVRAHGGMGYAAEYDVERYFREAMVPRIAPVSREMVLSYIAERVLGLPRSY